MLNTALDHTSPNVEVTMMLIKPDGVRKRLIGAIINRVEAQNLDVLYVSRKVLTESQVRKLYHHLESAAFFPHLLAYMTSGPLVIVVWKGPHAIRVVRQLVGATNPAHAAKGTIRSDFGASVEENICHSSSCVDDVNREMGILVYDKPRASL